MMKTTLKTLLAVATLSVAAMANAADTKTATKAPEKAPFTKEEMAMLQFCDSSSFGLVVLADMRQRGMSKADATKELETIIKAMNDSSEDKEATKQLGEFWRMNIDGMWETKVYDTQEDKAGFVQAVYQQSMSTCIADISTQPKG